MPSAQPQPTMAERTPTGGPAPAAVPSGSPTHAAPGEAGGSQADTTEQLPAWASSLDLSGLSPESRQQVLTFGKSLYGDYQRKTAELSREREQLQTYAEEAKGLVERLKAAPAPAASAQERKTTLDTFEAEILDPAQRQAFRQFRKGIREDSGVEALQKELEEIKGLLQGLQQTTMLSKCEQLQTSFAAMPKAYQPLLEKYQPQLIEAGTKYPTLTPKQLLKLLVTDAEYDTAVIAENTTTTKSTTTKKDALPLPHQASASQELLQPKRTELGKYQLGKRWDLKGSMGQIFADVKAALPK